MTTKEWKTTTTWLWFPISELEMSLEFQTEEFEESCPIEITPQSVNQLLVMKKTPTQLQLNSICLMVLQWHRQQVVFSIFDNIDMHLLLNGVSYISCLHTVYTIIKVAYDNFSTWRKWWEETSIHSILLCCSLINLVITSLHIWHLV